jgi:hypothetical protein
MCEDYKSWNAAAQKELAMIFSDEVIWLKRYDLEFLKSFLIVKYETWSWGCIWLRI